jgi:hypothetical protein
VTDLTTAQKNRLRRRIGDSGATQAFSDEELQDAFDEAGEDLSATTIILLEWLLADAAKFNDYRAGQVTENRSQVYDHVARNLAYGKQEAASGSTQVKIVGMRAVPPRDRDVPDA